MKIAIVGAGISGVTTAYELAQDGHEVHVFDKNAAIAEGASFSHAGLLSRALTLPFSHPRWPENIWFPFFRATEKIAIRSGSRLADLQWFYKWRRSADATVFNANLLAACSLASYSIDCLNTLVTENTLPLEHSDGSLVLFATAAEAQRFHAKFEALHAAGFAHKALSAEEIWQREPGLNSQAPLHSGLLFANDKVANGRQFAQLIKEKALRAGVRFEMGRTITSIISSPVLGLLEQGHEGAHMFDRVVVCTGSDTQALLNPSGMRLPLYTLQSHSLSAPVKEPIHAPISGLLDSHSQLCMARIGNRIRIWGGFEMGGKTQPNPKILQRLYLTLQNKFPGAANLQSGTQTYKSTLSVSRDGLPLIGPSTIPNVLLNTAHGPNAWTMACGAARIIADMVAHRAPAVETLRFAPNRSF